MKTKLTKQEINYFTQKVGHYDSDLDQLEYAMRHANFSSILILVKFSNNN